MSMMLKSQNPEAAARIGDLSLPGVGMWVAFHHRPGQQRGGMLEVPALVMKRDETNRCLTLMLKYAVDDEIVKERVSRRAGNEEGWEYVDDGRKKVSQVAAEDEITLESLNDRFEGFKDEITEFLLGDQPKPAETFFAMLRRIEGGLEDVRKALPKPKRQPQG